MGADILSGPLDKKRRRRTKAQIEQLERQIYDVLFNDHPQSIRHVFYLMTNPRLPEPVEKSQRGYVQVQDRLKKMRLSGVVPYGWITDSTRRGYHVQTYHGADDFLRQTAGLYRADLWSMSDHYVEVWCESRSIAGVIEDECEELAVSLYPAGVFSSMTLVYEAPGYINDLHEGKPVEVIYIGDYDPAGVLIDRDIEKKLRRHLNPDVEMSFHRIAITPEQIAEYDLPTKSKNTDERRVLELIRTVEAEAMPARILRRLLRDKVESFLPPRAMAVAKVAEERERRSLIEMAGAT